MWFIPHPSSSLIAQSHINKPWQVFCCLFQYSSAKTLEHFRQRYKCKFTLKNWLFLPGLTIMVHYRIKNSALGVLHWLRTDEMQNECTIEWIGAALLTYSSVYLSRIKTHRWYFRAEIMSIRFPCRPLQCLSISCQLFRSTYLSLCSRKIKYTMLLSRAVSQIKSLDVFLISSFKR